MAKSGTSRFTGGAFAVFNTMKFLASGPLLVATTGKTVEDKAKPLTAALLHHINFLYLIVSFLS